MHSWILVALELLTFLSYIQPKVNNNEHTGNGTCLKFDADGICTCCDSEYRGQACDLKCEYCSSRLVLDEICSYSCITGYYGEICQNKCPTTCADGSNGKHFCKETNGQPQCVNGCIPGFAGQQCLNCKDSRLYGDYCNITCSKGCLYGICNRTGHCTEGCIDGFYGENCSSQCGNNCIRGRCTHDIHSTYTCTQGCKDGFTGRNCSEMCPNDCKMCNQRTGRCTACVNNYVQTSNSGECIKVGRAGDVIWIIVGVAVAVLISVIVTIVIRKKCYSKDESRDDDQEGYSKDESRDDDQEGDDGSDSGYSYYSNGSVTCHTSSEVQPLNTDVIDYNSDSGCSSYSHYTENNRHEGSKWKATLYTSPRH